MQIVPEFHNAAVDAFPPAFEDVGEGLAHLDETEQNAIKEMEERVREMMETRNPRDATYMMRADKGTVLKTESEFTYCVQNGIGVRYVTYGHALQLLKEEDAAKRRKLKSKKARKTAKKARKKNRR